MGKVIQMQRRGHAHAYRSHSRAKRARPEHRTFDFSERQGFVKGVVRKLNHEAGRGVPIANVEFRHPTMYKKVRKNMLAVEGLFSGQFIFAGAKAGLSIGNILPLGKMPEGTICCNVENKPGDKGKIARRSGESVVIIGHTDDGKTRVKLPSGAKKTLLNSCRATVGIIAGGGRIEKPLLKAGAAYYKSKAIGHKVWPRVRCVAKNPVEHPFGGGNHQHIGRSSTVARTAVAGRKVGLVAARRTGKLRGSRQIYSKE
eukprot:CAMPEP_0117448520 /NCGR_PEP_ID=MMETSP0759-20121206/7444_1 /TAXON_ID=63605 /ORGANISM="Percolomonas cosmopolitus, Strain WS" /LENGTH=256 /DNA_ID=CAMNT_0005240911 /DNA_START=101 /DNA_END=871 /DNA_ORIENTATION=+